MKILSNSSSKTSIYLSTTQIMTVMSFLKSKPNQRLFWAIRSATRQIFISTTISVLETKDFEFSDYFTLHPNPANTILNIESKKGTVFSSVSIYNALGQLVLVYPNFNSSKTIDISSLRSGNYYLKMTGANGSTNRKFIKN